MKREEQIKNLKDFYDLVIIGGGSTGLALALDSSSRGYKTLLLERYDFAKGTSSRSTKLLHGGVRYLAQGNLTLVYEALHERNQLLINACNLSKKQKFIIPAKSFFKACYYFIDLKLYDFLAGKFNIGKAKYLNKKQAKNSLKNIKKEELQFGVSYYDACFDDARMAFSLAKTAYEFGACVLNYMNVTQFIKDDKGILKGLYVFDELNQKEFKINAKCIINATGVFSSEILKMDSSPSDIVPSQGIHIVVNKEFFPNENALIIPATSDGRVLFAIPWYDKVLIGTTDTKIEKVTYEPKALEEEIEFILENVAKYFEKKPKREDIKSIFVGLRPLINDANKDTKNLSRSHKIEVSKSNLISINGGKWTTCRIMAEQTINKAIDLALLSDKKCKSKDIKLSTYDKNLTFGERLSVYGLDAKAILNLEAKGLDKKIHKNYPYTYAQVFWALEEEMAQKIEDVLARRIRLLFLDAKACEECARELGEYLGNYFKWNKEKIENEINEFIHLTKQYQI